MSEQITEDDVQALFRGIHDVMDEESGRVWLKALQRQEQALKDANARAEAAEARHRTILECNAKNLEARQQWHQRAMAAESELARVDPVVEAADRLAKSVDDLLNEALEDAHDPLSVERYKALEVALDAYRATRGGEAGE